MRVLEKHEPAISNHCILCEQGLDRQRQDIVIDVGIDIELPGGHPLDGRKYVCQGCLLDIIRACGLMNATDVVDVQKYLREYRYKTEQIHEDVADLLDQARARFTELPAPPNLDYITVPDHVLIAETNTAKKDKKRKDWVSVPASTEAPF